VILHRQRDFGREHGSCFATAIASVLDLPLEAVPNFGLFLRWPEVLDLWCRQRGIVWHHWHANQERRRCARCHDDVRPVELCGLEIPTRGLVVAGGRSPRANGDGMRHAVVWDAAFDHLAHDPHPDGTGLDGAPEGWSWFVKVAS
jgi:hypothetical protein